MIVVGFVSQKGGVGKSTLARALAVSAVKAGWKVRIADLDELQHTCIDWHFRRKNQGLPDIDVRPFKSVDAAMAQSLKDGVELVIFDGPAKADFETLRIAAASNVLVQPSNGHVDDLGPAVKTFHKLVKECVPKAMLRIALSRIGTPAEEARARAYIAEAGYQCLAGALYEKPAYGQAQDMGQAVIETRFDKLNGQADLLIESLLGAIEAAQAVQIPIKTSEGVRVAV